MKPYTSFQVNKLITLIKDIKELEILEEIIYENEHKYDCTTFFLFLSRIASKRDSLRRVKE